MLECEDSRLTEMRERCMLLMYQHVHVLVPMRRELNSIDFLRAIVGRRRLLPLFAAYVADVFALCETVPMLNTPSMLPDVAHTPGVLIAVLQYNPTVV